MNVTSIPRRNVVTAALIAGILLPPLVTLCLIYRYGVNVPFADDFTLAPMFVAAHNGTLKIGQFIAQHNEHRMVLLRIFSLAFAYFAHGNLRAEMLFSFIIVLATAWLLWRLIRRTIDGTLQKQFGTMLLLSLLLFSPVQAENWTWGFQFALFLNNLLVVSAISIATSRRSRVVKFAVCAAFAALATYSFGSGAVLWILSFPLALIDKNPDAPRRQRIRWGIPWALLGALTVASYFVHYRRPATHPPIGASRHVTDYLAYALAFLGGHLSRPGSADPLFAPMVIGALLVVLTTVAIVYLVRLPGFEDRRRALPWIALGAYALLSAGLATLGRVGFGVPQALESRYTSFSIYLSIGLVGLSAIVLEKNTSKPWQNGGIAFVVALALLSLGAYSAGIGAMAETKRSRLHGKAALLFANVLHSDQIYESHLCANAHDAKALANMLNQLGLLQPPMITSSRVSALQSVTADRQKSGYLDEVHCSGSQCLVRGWAFLPASRRTFDAVVLSYGTGPAAALFQMTTEAHQRLDVLQTLRDPELLASGWTAQIDGEAVPGGLKVITGWAVDSETAVLYQLEGSGTLQ